MIGLPIGGPNRKQIITVGTPLSQRSESSLWSVWHPSAAFSIEIEVTRGYETSTEPRVNQKAVKDWAMRYLLNYNLKRRTSPMVQIL